MIGPFKETGRLTRAQYHFNQTISSERQVVERTIGHLKGRFRRLRDLDCSSIKEVCYLITAACVLHNLCVVSNDEIEEYIESEADYNQNPNNFQPVYRNANAGTARRTAIVQHLEQFI